MASQIVTCDASSDNGDEERDSEGDELVDGLHDERPAKGTCPGWSNRILHRKLRYSTYVV